MGETLSIREYDKLFIRRVRDLDRNTISTSDAAYLQSVIIDNCPVFSFGNRCLIAQNYVGVIQLPDFSLEILPKIYGEVDCDKLRDVLIRMLMVTNQTSSIRRFKSSVSARKNSLIEMVIYSFLYELETYLSAGLQHEYKKVTNNINKLKGRIVFSQQLRKNILAPTKFYCKYSKYIADNELNRFFRTCLIKMSQITRDVYNKSLIEDLLLSFTDISEATSDTVLGYRITFNSINARAHEAYILGKMFLERSAATLSAGSTQMYTMMFNMNQLYEMFVYRVSAIVFGSKVTYQKKGNHMISRVSDGKRFINLRPDLTLKVSHDEQWIIDTKWKLPSRFAKESDIYQMNAYSSAIHHVNRVILLYPRVPKTDQIVGQYLFSDAFGIQRLLEIRTIDLMGCLSWGHFLRQFKETVTFQIP